MSGSSASGCIACKEKIHPEAKKCPHCGTMQSRFLSWLLIFAGLSGFLVISAAAVSFLYEYWRELQIWRDPISIVHYSYKRGAVFLNKSKSPLFVKSVIIRSANERFLFSEDFNISVKERNIAIFGNPLFVAIRSPDDRGVDEWLSALGSGKKCPQILFGKGIPHSKQSERVALGKLTYVDGTGKIREKTISLEEKLICGSTIWNIGK